ncbi:hypothetical protein PUR71_20260, partial [Streptomyces sp. SP17BM10]|uniref:hypothetical protein n=1 Tax=Streptomyces sp. SP17BM10 TaxID=3002530 RepID=UPI002E7766F8
MLSFALRLDLLDLAVLSVFCAAAFAPFHCAPDDAARAAGVPRCDGGKEAAYREEGQRGGSPFAVIEEPSAWEGPTPSSLVPFAFDGR